MFHGDSIGRGARLYLDATVATEPFASPPYAAAFATRVAGG